MSLVFGSKIVKSPHSLAELKSDTYLLRELNMKELGCSGWDQILYFPSGRQEVEDPKQVFVGMAALAYALKKLKSTSPAGPTDVRTIQIAREFQEIMDCDITYFEGIHWTAYPTNHPVLKNPQCELLRNYHLLKNEWRLKDNIQFEFFDCTTHQVLLQEKQAEPSTLDFVSEDEHTIHATDKNLVQLMNQFMPGTRAAFDLYGNLWISSQTLWGLLTGHFCLPKYWCDHVQMRRVSRTSIENTSQIIETAVERNLRYLELLKQMNIQPSLVPIRIMDEDYCWSLEEIHQSTKTMQKMLL